jgi:hypothetical protein
MLSMALSKMIDRCEGIFFLNTPKSLRPTDVVKGKSGVTESPWIYSELATTQFIRKRELSEYGQKR